MQPSSQAIPHATITELLHFVDLRVLTVQRTVAARWWNFKQVVSPFTRLWLVLDGQATVKHHGEVFELRAGSLHLVPAFTRHDCDCNEYFDHYHLHFLPRVQTGIDLFSLVDCQWQVSAAEDCLKWLEQLEKIYPKRKLSCFDPTREEYRQAFTESEHVDTNNNESTISWWEAQTIIRLLLSPFISSARLHDGMHAQVTQRFMAVQEYIHQNISKPIMLVDLARVTGLHPTYFSDRFNQIVGVRPLEYLMQRRMECAQYLLLTSRASIKEVAYAVGLRDPAYFTRLFIKYHGVSPSTYRVTHTV